LRRRPEGQSYDGGEENGYNKKKISKTIIKSTTQSILDP